MKLHHNPASPFVRMVLVTAHEAGLADRIEHVSTGVFLPNQPHDGVIGDNPLGKIPALVLDDGSTLFDSRVICEYLAARAPEAGLLPADGADRWRCLTVQAVAQGLADAGVSLRYETAVRPAEFHWDGWIDAQTARMERVFDALHDRYFDDLCGIDLGSLSVAVALSYMDFRFPDTDWRHGRVKLADWYAGMAERPSMKETEPYVL
ncbi:MAG: glutathione S-transferase family protein [Hyphomicrobiales bacterium]